MLLRGNVKHLEHSGEAFALHPQLQINLSFFPSLTFWATTFIHSISCPSDYLSEAQGREEESGKENRLGSKKIKVLGGGRLLNPPGPCNSHVLPPFSGPKVLTFEKRLKHPQTAHDAVNFRRRAFSTPPGFGKWNTRRLWAWAVSGGKTPDVFNMVPDCFHTPGFLKISKVSSYQYPVLQVEPLLAA